MNDEQTNETDTQGEEGNKPVSEYDKTLALVKRREEASKVEAELLSRKEKLASDNLLSGDTGGHIPAEKPKEETPREYKDRVMSGQFE